MENQTNDALASIMTDEFKAEIVKRNNVIRTLNFQEESAKTRINELTLSIEELSKKKSNLENDLAPVRQKLEDDYKQRVDSFENTKKSVTDSLDSREKDLQKNIDDHSDAVKSHIDNVQEFNKEKEAFKSHKIEISSALKELSLQFNGFIVEAIQSIEG